MCILATVLRQDNVTPPALFTLLDWHWPPIYKSAHSAQRIHIPRSLIVLPSASLLINASVSSSCCSHLTINCNHSAIWILLFRILVSSVSSLTWVWIPCPLETDIIKCFWVAPSLCLFLHLVHHLIMSSSSLGRLSISIGLGLTPLLLLLCVLHPYLEHRSSLHGLPPLLRYSVCRVSVHPRSAASRV